MSSKNIGEKISNLRKVNGMTQNDLAKKMNVTDATISKWERNASCPDIDTINEIAKVFGITVDELLNSNKEKNEIKIIKQIVDIALIAVGLSMGVCIVLKSLFDNLSLFTSMYMMGLGLTSFGIYLAMNIGKK